MLDAPSDPNYLPLKNFGEMWSDLAVSVVSSGGGTRTPDTRIMIPRSDRRKPKGDKEEANINGRLALHLPYETLPPELTALIDAWPSLPEPIKAEILAMVRASGSGGGG